MRTLFIPGQQIDDAFLAEMDEKFIRADMGVKNVAQMVAAVRDRWRLGKIKNAQEAEEVVRQEMLAGWGPPEERELKFATTGPTVILVAGINGAGKTTSIAKLAWIVKRPDEEKGDGLRPRTPSVPLRWIN